MRVHVTQSKEISSKLVHSFAYENLTKIFLKALLTDIELRLVLASMVYEMGR